MKNLLDYLLLQITGKEIPTEETQNENNIELTIHPSSEDAGIIIGKSGKTIKAIQEILRIKGKKENTFVSLHVDAESE